MADFSKQMVDFRPGKSFPTAQSAEYQRKWANKTWESKSQERNYDRTRERLNFEVTKGGIVQAIDRSRSVSERIQARLAQLGIKDPNLGLPEPKYRTYVDFVIGGSRARMHEMAFGASDAVDLRKGADNSHITRHKEIEQWAKDIYDYVARKWGEDNIAGFYVHLDEKNPHIHCTIVPIDERGKLSFRKVFHGDTYDGYGKYLQQMHDEFAEVNRKWGLVRGTNIHETGARHISSEEYRRNLSAECTSLEEQIRNSRLILKSLEEDIRKAEKKVKGLTTMIQNLESKRETLQEQITELQHQVESGDIDAFDAEKRIGELEAELKDTLEKLEDKQTKLESAEEDLNDLREQISVGQSTEMRLLEMRAAATADLKEQAEMRVSHSLLPDLINDFRRMVPNLNFSAMESVEGSLLMDLAEYGNEILAMAALLYVGYVDQSTMVAQGGGGGGTSSDLPWGRDEDEDDIKWAHRCMHKARSIVKARSGGRGR